MTMCPHCGQETLLSESADVPPPEVASEVAAPVPESDLASSTVRGKKSPLLVLALVMLVLVGAGGADWLAPHDPNLPMGMRWDPPSAEHWLGLDQIGRDMFSRILYGGRISIGLAMLATILAFVVGVVTLALSGAPDERGFWPVLVFALSVGLFLAKDRTVYCETAIAGMSRPIVMIMVMAWLLASSIGVIRCREVFFAISTLGSTRSIGPGAWWIT